MSYLNLKGKPVWGSSVYRLDIVTTSKRLSADISGTITLYERRHETATNKFNNLVEFVDTLKEYWTIALPNSRIQETRVARWLEEYFGDMGVRVSYDDVINAMRGEVEEVQELEVSDERKLTSDEILSLIDQPTNFNVFGMTKSIKGDLTDISGIDKVLTKFLEDNKQNKNTQAKSNVSFKDSNAQERNINEARTVVNPILDESVSLWTGFSNTFSEPVTDIVITDTIPFAYKINAVKQDANVEKISEELVEEGMKYVWKYAKLEPGEKIRIDYELEHRLLRSILIRDDNDITLLHTYEDIKREGKDIWIEATYSFKEKTDTIENVVILDQIPDLFQFVSSEPEAIAPLGNITHYQGETEIEWRHKNVPVNTQFVVTYDLNENPRLYRDKITIQDNEENDIAEIVKIVKPLTDKPGYGIIFALHPYKDIEGVILVDRVTNEFIIEPIHSDTGNIEEDKGEAMTRIRWKLEECKKDEEVFAYFRYSGEANYDLSNFSVIVPKQASMIVGQEVTQKSDKVVMPYIYENEVDK